MGRNKRKAFINVEDIVAFYNHVMSEQPSLRFLIPLILLLWAIERWVFSFSNWVPLVVAVCATIQYGNYQRQILVEDLNKKWKRIILNTSPITPMEHCEWLNKLLMEIWQNYLNPRFSLRFRNIVERRLKHRKSRLIEKVELQEFSLGSIPPSLGLNGTCWSTSGDQLVMRLGFDWDTNEISIMLLVKMAKPLIGTTARVVINSLHIKGDLLIIPILDGKAILYSFVSTPDVRLGVAFGSGGSESLPATGLPGVSSWLVKLLAETLVRMMVEPRRSCLSLPAIDLRKSAIGGVLHVTVICASKLRRSSLGERRLKEHLSSSVNGVENFSDDGDLHTFVEVELGELTRRTDVRSGPIPQWDSTFNMALHDNAGILHFYLYECTPGSVEYNNLASCEVKIRYVADDSTIFWAIGPDSGVIAKHAEVCGKVEMVVPFEGVDSGELRVRLMLKEWQFSDGSHSLNHFPLKSEQSVSRSSNVLPGTGRRFKITVLEGKDLAAKDKSGKLNPYVKLQYGKAVQRTSTAHTSNPAWNEKFEFDEIGGDGYLRVKCLSEEIFADDSVGNARVSLEGLVEGSVRDVWVPLEKVNSGEVRLQMESVRVDDPDGSRGSTKGFENGWVELVLIEGRDLRAADLRGTSDPYVRVHYGHLKKSTKVVYKTLNPQWHQTLEFPDDGSPLVLHVKDHNALLPTSSIGDCVVEYQGLPPNVLADKWIPLQGVKTGEIHIQIMRRVREPEKKPTLHSQSSLTKEHHVSTQMKQKMIKFESLIDDGEHGALLTALSELETLEDEQQKYMVQLENEQTLLLNKIKELGQEIINSPSSLTRISSSP